MAQILIKMNRSEEAMGYLRHCLRLAPGSVETLTMMGIALNLEGHYRRAEWFLGAALERLSGDKRSLLWMIDCKLRRSEEKAAKAYALQLADGTPVSEIKAAIDKALNDRFMPPESAEQLSRWVESQVREHTIRMLEGLGDDIPGVARVGRN
jgi:predicted Zn-dependent protease